MIIYRSFTAQQSTKKQEYGYFGRPNPCYLNLKKASQSDTTNDAVVLIGVAYCATSVEIIDAASQSPNREAESTHQC